MTAFEAACTIEADWRVRRYRLTRAGEPLSFAEFVELAGEDDAFADDFGALLAASPQPAFFWETPPVTAGTENQPFEFVLVDARGLPAMGAEPDVFAAHYDEAEDGVATFWNLGSDALLVAPCPSARIPLAAHAHLAAYLRAASSEEIRALWRAIARAITVRLSDRPLWVSTSGLGVAWLHVRLDARPKYYQYAPYREPPGVACDA